MNKNLPKYFAVCLLSMTVLLGGTSPALAHVSSTTVTPFAVLAGTNATCTAGVIVGDVGVSPGGAVPFTNTGCLISGTTPPATNAAATQARMEFLATYAALRLSGPCTQMLGSTLAGENLAPGVYCLDAVAKTGTLTLTGPSDGVWIFLVDGALTGTNFTVVMAGGGQPCNVFWVPSAAATMTDSALKGSILAGDPINGSITLTGGSLAGQALANVAVTITGTGVIGCDALPGKKHHDKTHRKCNQGLGNGPEGCDPGNSNHNHSSNDENGGTPGNPGRHDRR